MNARDNKEGDIGVILTRLAEAGTDLYVQLFEGEVEDDKRGSSRFEDYQNFWVTKFSVATVYGLIDSPPSPRMPTEETTLLAALSEDVRSRLDDDVRKEWRWEHGASCSEDFFRRLQENRQRSHLIYFYCHANGEQLALRGNPEDVIDVELFRSKVARRKSMQPAIVFLNGCSTATGHQQRGWIGVTCKHGLQGFVGTETKIPELFAWRYGIEFLQLFLEEEFSIREALGELRRRHWPLSLLYGAYCFPELAVQGSRNPSPPGRRYGNLSEMELGR